jgi:pyruvate formate-lyase/glycerol dehydratase family glycyl radical enzyme
MEAIRDFQELEQDLGYTEDMQKGSRADTGSTERVRRLSSALRSTEPGICLHAARAYTEVFRETEGQPVEIRFAEAFRRTLESLPAVIDEGELIVGLNSCGLKKMPVMPMNHAGWLVKELDSLSTRRVDPVPMPEAQLEEARQLLSYWFDKTLYTFTEKLCPPDLARKVQGTGWAETGPYFHKGGAHFNPPYELVLEKGLSWYEERVKKQLAVFDYGNPEQMGKEHFYHGLLMVIEAAKNFAQKYAEKARELSRQERDPKRRAELNIIGETMDRVPYRPAQSFREAIQSVWFVHMVLHVEGTGPAYNIGRFDQFMYPFYKADLEKGNLTAEEARELIESLFLKMSGNLLLSTRYMAETTPSFAQHQTLDIGGVDKEDKDASNELSYLVLEAVKSVRTVQPDIALLCHPRETPYELKLKAAELVALGLGLPKFISTQTVKTGLMASGYSLEEARTGWIRGCSELYGPGCKQYGYTVATQLNGGIALEAALFNGRKRMPNQNMSGEVLGVETGDPRTFKTFDEFMAAFKTQLSQEIRDGHIAASYADKAKMRHLPLLLQSLFTEACIERGLWANAGGAVINVGPGMPFTGGIATVADSLAAIKKLVYEEQRITMDELLQAIDANFEGYEAVRQMLIHDAPKYGNDDDYVDDLAREIWQFYCAQVRTQITPLGNKNEPSCCIVTAYTAAGAYTWATPDGRKAGQALSNHVSPSDQRDLSGPVAHIKSVTKLGLDSGFGTIHNMYFTNIDRRERLHQLVDLIDLYHSFGGHHLQINCQDKNVLVDAQKHPEKYPTLMIRVAGYMTYFVELPKQIQDEIINRTSLEI